MVRDAQLRFAYMCNTFDSTKLITYAVDTGIVPNMTSAQAAFNGLLQWFACHDNEDAESSRQAMLSGPVHMMHQAFVQNTELYSQFCQTYIGAFVQLLNSNTAEQVDFARQTGYLEETINRLVEVFEYDLSSVLLPWQHQQYDHTVPIAAVSVMGHEVHKYQKITDLEHGTKDARLTKPRRSR